MRQRNIVRFGNDRSFNKYRAVTCFRDGIRFDSRKEADYYVKLKLLKRAKIIKDFKRQVTFPLFGCEALLPGEKAKIVKIEKVADHRVDFVVSFPDGREEVHEVKGFATDVWNLKRKLFEANYPGIPYRVVY